MFLAGYGGDIVRGRGGCMGKISCYAWSNRRLIEYFDIDLAYEESSANLYFALYSRQVIIYIP